ncbi:MAG: exodeoxyribonuclease VII large subunit, partial [Mycobacterium leprae]
QVLLFGSVSVYERDGAYQMYAVNMEPAGVGALALQYEQLKNRLEAEGLFDKRLKRPLPLMPKRVGLITAMTGAAIRDLISVSTRRFPGIRLLIAPALVQGAEAPDSLMRALKLVAAQPEVDVIIMGRGGGSLEDLWAFNNEELARAIRACPIPVVSAVGHETDFTIADFVADLRAPTPSAAAEIVVPSRSELIGRIGQLQSRMITLVHRSIDQKRLRLKALSQRPVLLRPQGRLLQDRQRLDELIRRLQYTRTPLLKRNRQRLEGLAGRLDALSPLAVLSRGYAITRDTEGRVIREASAVTVGDQVKVMLHRGELTCVVESTAEPEGGEQK